MSYLKRKQQFPWLQEHNSNMNVTKLHKDSLAVLAKYFKLDETFVIGEWEIFKLFLWSQKEKEKTASHVLVSLLTDDLGDAFPTLRLLGQILLVCPLGTANVEKSLSVMSRICNRLRQRLTADHLNHLVLISIEGPDVLTEQQL